MIGNVVTTGHQYYVDPSEANQGVAGNGKSIAAWLSAIGTSKHAELIFDHKNIADNTTTYTVSTAIDMSSYPLIHFVFKPGALLGGTANVKFPSPGNIEARPTQQIFTGSGVKTASRPGTVYPEWWGVDGTSDETEINKAFASLSAGGVVHLKAASYSIDGSITPASNTVLRADPWTTVELAATTDAPMISISGKTNVRITGGGTFDGAKTTQAGDTDDHVLYIASSSSYITVDDVTFTNSYDDTINSSTTSNLSIRNCRITNSRDNGIVLTGDSKVSITDNYFSGNVAITGTANIVLWTGCSDVLIARNSFYDTGEVAGQGHGVYTYMSQGIRIHDNYFQNMFGMGVEVNAQTAGTVVMITGNIMHQCGNVPAQTGGVWVGTDASAVIANNAITEAQYHGVYLYQSDRCTVSNNTILDTKNLGYGLRLLDATYTSLIGNTVGDTGGSPTSAESISVGSVGAGPLSVTAAGNIMAGSTYNYIMNKEKGIETAANYETFTNWKMGNTLDGLTGQTTTLAANYTLYPGYSGVYHLDPGGSHRNIVCTTGFRQGTLVVIVNTADAAENLMFDSAGINQTVGQNQRGIFSYDGTAWRKIYIG